MHRRSYLPDSHNRRNLMGRAKMRAERDAALRRADEAERTSLTKTREVAQQNSIRAKVGTFLQKTKRFFTQPITFGKKGA